MMRLKKLSKRKKILLAAVALLLCAALITGICVYIEHSRYFCQYAKPFSVSGIAGSEQVQLVAHRGAAVEAPENTLPAYEKAAQLGYQYAETDIRATADGVWVLMHDASLARMTGFRGEVEQMTLAEVREHSITKGGNIEQYPHLEIPTYEQFLKLCKQTGLHPVIEIKTKPNAMAQVPYRAIVTLLEQYGLSKEAVIISFEYEALECIREYNREIALQLLVKNPDEGTFTKIEKLGNCGLDCEYKALLRHTEYIEIAKSAGIPVNAWTVDDADAFEKLCAAGVDYVTTNAAR